MSAAPAPPERRAPSAAGVVRRALPPRVLSRLRPLVSTVGGGFAVAALSLVLLTALVSLFWTPHDPAGASAERLWQPPSLSYPLGTDGSGRDIASRLIAGSRVTVLVAAGTGLAAAVIGLVLGVLGGLGPRRARQAVAVGVDVLIAFPTVLLAMMLAAVYGSGVWVVVAALGIAFGVSIGRVLRAEFAQVAEADFVLAARAAGLSRPTILRRHLIPSVRPVFIVQLSLSMGLAVLAESSLSYLGFGAPPGVPSWGRMLAESQRYISVHPGTVLWPGLAIALTVLGFLLLGDALRDALDLRGPRVARPAPGATGATGPVGAAPMEVLP
ncbi:MAG: ABC transporter permease [Leucobacter sp.]